MKKLSGIRISHKISSLMAGLIVGFILMGVAWYAQINSDIEQKALDKNYQQSAQPLEKMNADLLFITNSLQSLAGQPEATRREALEQFTRRMQQSVGELARIDYRFFSPAAHEAVTVTTDEFLASVDELLQRSMQSGFIGSAALATVGDGLRQALASYQDSMQQNHQRRVQVGLEEKHIAQWIFAVVLLVTAIATTLGLFLIYRSIVLPLWQMQSVIARQNRGDDKARVRIAANDELGNLGAAFNRLLDERMQVLTEKYQENEILNNSIIGLIRALDSIAKRDLTIKVPVSEDVTGAVSDAVNLLTAETGKTLHQVRNVSERVKQLSSQLESRSQRVIEVAQQEHAQVVETIIALEQSAKTMGDVAREARTVNGIASTAINFTAIARESVTQTVEGIQLIRSTLFETEKKIKRLGERSQEISGIVSLINAIAERTHILALNASMHAASAGEAGKGFVVVAEEVQRLAENSRAATLEIAAMVNNIRIETSEAVNVLNKLITQVAEGTRLAGDSGSKMQQTEAATRQLVNHVKSIAVNSVNQANTLSRLRDKALLITESTDKTRAALEEQHLCTEDMKHCASSLMQHVSVFTLPAQRSDGTTELVTARQRPSHDEKTSADPIVA